jgi:XTP/dITP diphosphohydrolase
LTEKGLLLATTNQGKIRELKSSLLDLALPVLSLQELRIDSIFPEKGRTFLENARGKSLYYSRFWSDLTLAEDSGLEVDFLEGDPGIFSSRYAGPNATDEENLKKVLRLLAGVAKEKRRARFVSCIVLSKKQNVITEFQEKVEGFITTEKRGREGFGYDPIFFYPPLEKTFAELSPEKKNDVSHRGRTLRKLKVFLSEYLKGRIP